MEDKELNLDFSLMPLYNLDYEAGVLVDTPLMIFKKEYKKELRDGWMVNFFHESFHLQSMFNYFYQPLLTTIFLNYLFLKTVEGLRQSSQQEVQVPFRRFYMEQAMVDAFSQKFYRTPKEKRKRFEKAGRRPMKLDFVNEMVTWLHTLLGIDKFLGAFRGGNIEISSQLADQVRNEPFFRTAVDMAAKFARRISKTNAYERGATYIHSIPCHTATELLQKGKWRVRMSQQQFGKWWKQKGGSPPRDPQEILQRLHKGETLIFPPPPALTTMFLAPERCLEFIEEEKVESKRIESFRGRVQWLKEIYLLFRDDLKNWPAGIRLKAVLFPLWELRVFHEMGLAWFEENKSEKVIGEEMNQEISQEKREILDKFDLPEGHPMLCLAPQDPGFISHGENYILPEELKTLGTKTSEKDWPVVPAATDLLEELPGDLQVPVRDLWLDFFLVSQIVRGTGNEKYVNQCPFVACFKDESGGAFPKWCAKTHLETDSLDYCRIPRSEPSLENFAQFLDRQLCPFWNIVFDLFTQGKMIM